MLIMTIACGTIRDTDQIMPVHGPISFPLGNGMTQGNLHIANYHPVPYSRNLLGDSSPVIVQLLD